MVANCFSKIVFVADFEYFRSTKIQNAGVFHQLHIFCPRMQHSAHFLITNLISNDKLSDGKLSYSPQSFTLHSFN